MHPAQQVDHQHAAGPAGVSNSWAPRPGACGQARIVQRPDQARLAHDVGQRLASGPRSGCRASGSRRRRRTARAAVFSVMPKPPAAFSALTTTKSRPSRRRSAGQVLGRGPRGPSGRPRRQRKPVSFHVLSDGYVPRFGQDGVQPLVVFLARDLRDLLAGVGQADGEHRPLRIAAPPGCGRNARRPGRAGRPCGRRPAAARSAGPGPAPRRRGGGAAMPAASGTVLGLGCPGAEHQRRVRRRPSPAGRSARPASRRSASTAAGIDLGAVADDSRRRP